jgi:dolichyl-phosphate beta-glucosyltransferase
VSKDTQCGFKAFRRAAAREIFSRARIDGFAFDTEILLLARQRGLRVDELPVEWINDQESKFRPLGDGWRSFRDLLRIRRLVGKA